MVNPEVSSPNDFKVVIFKNGSDFDFTPALGAMFDSNPIFGTSGESIKIDEEVTLPYHVGSLIAKNLAKAVMNKGSKVDEKGVPTGVPLWDETSLQQLQQSYLTEMYTEAKPTAVTETDRLMAKVAELQSFVEKNVTEKVDSKTTDEPSKEDALKKVVYSDKSEVIAALEKRKIAFNARTSKADLEKLLA